MGMSRFTAAMLVLVPVGLGVQALGQTTTAPATPSQAGGAGLAIPELLERLRICTRNNRAFRAEFGTKGGVGPVSSCRADVLRRHLERR